MNYVELHIGDYDKATAHLSACEDGIYGRLIRWYYDTESALLNDVKAIQRRVRARDRAEKKAVETILEEFFELQDGAWHHKRCDEEIARYQDKREKAKRSASARWNSSERNANASPNADAEPMRTHSVGNAHQSPDTRQEQKKEREKTTAVEIDTWLGSLDGEDAIPGDDSIFGWAEKTGVPLDFLALSWITFRDDMRERHKRQKDWRAHYRNAVKRNWYKLWWFDATGTCQLTTTGEQAKRAAA